MVDRHPEPQLPTTAVPLKWPSAEMLPGPPVRSGRNEDGVGGNRQEKKSSFSSVILQDELIR